jgi:acetoacetyl-CoA synthetase
MGTSEFYRVVEAQPEILDSLVVDLEYLGRPSCLLLFVVLRPGTPDDAALRQRLAQAIRAGLSARHVPDEVHVVAAIPRTLTGKKLELPVKKLLLGHPPERVFKRDGIAPVEAIDAFVAFAARAGGARG